MAKQIDRPIFLLGPGRAGSTLLNSLLTLHRDVGYFISWSNLYPRHPWLAVGARLRVPIIERKVKHITGYPGPTEAYGIWKHHFPNFWKVCRSACTDKANAARLVRNIQIHLSAQGKTRFLAKLTGPPISSFLRSIFPDAQFVWLDRDPRAVCYSYFLRGWIGVRPELKANLNTEDQLRHAARRYLGYYGEISHESAPHYWLRYEDFVSEPVGQLRALLQYLELEPDARLLDYVSKWPIMKLTNTKWERELSASHQQILNKMLEQPLRDKRYMRRNDEL